MAATSQLRKAAFVEESAEVEVLNANLERLKGLTKKIQGSLNRLESSGKNVSEAISPIHGQTRKLQVTNTNVDRILEVLGRIRKPLDQRGQEENILRSDPRKVGLAEYLASLDRATSTLADLRGSNLKSNQQAIGELSELLKSGNRQLEFLFRDILQEDSRTIEPLHYLTKNLDFPSVPPEKLPRLRNINSHVVTAARQAGTVSSTTVENPTAKAYSDVRGEYLTNSLKNLALASVTTARKTAADALYRRGTNGFSLYAQAFADIAEPEARAVAKIFEPEEVDQVCRLTCQGSLRELGRTLKELETHIWENILTDCFLAFELIEIINNLTMRLRNITPVLVQPVQEAARPIRKVAGASLPRLIEDARNRVQSLPTVPMDGAAVPVTMEIMSRLQTLTEYLNPVCSILGSLGEGGWRNPSASTSLDTIDFDSRSNNTALFAAYASDIMDTMITNLEGKARAMLKTSSLQGVFMANNVAVMERMIRSSELAVLLEPVAPKLDQWRKKSSARYMDAWREPSAQLLDVQYTSRAQRPPSGGPNLDSATVVKLLGSKEKDAIKEKFRNFNASFDDLLGKHKSYKMEREVRSQLAKDVQAMIEPLYGRFWDRYHDVDKGKGKYVKYDKSQLSAALASMA